MQKVVLDTNVIVSSLIGTSYPKQIIFDFVLNKKLIVCISTEIFSEYIEVLNREKFLKYPEFVAKADIVTSKLYDLAIKLTPFFKLNIVNDESDNKFIELAVFANADFLITGNTHHFKMDKYENVKIVTPEVFVKQFKEL